MDQKPVLLKVRPDKKFKVEEVKGILRDIVYEQLRGKVYDHMYAPDWTKSLSHTIHEKLKELVYERYKFVVQVIAGEDRGQGLKILSGCHWDQESDDKTVVLYTGETLFCIVAVFTVFCYCYE